MKLKVPPRDSAGWGAFVEQYPLHKAVVGKGNGHIKEARVNQILEWIGKGCGRGRVQQLAAEQWGLTERVIDELRACADLRLREHYRQDRTDYLAEKLTQIDAAVELALADKQLSALVGLLALAGKWTKLEA
jgi:hypothetical protein